jgi:peptide/nickel transport system permease protein
LSAATRPQLPTAGPRSIGSSNSAWRRRHPIASIVVVRIALGLLTLFAVSIVSFLATLALPGNAACAMLGHGATPERLKALEDQLHLNRSLPSQYGSWIGGVLHGNFGTSLANGESVSSLVGPRLENSAVLVIGAGILGTLIAGILGLIAAARRDRLFDHIASVIALTITALPEFVVAIALVIVFAINALHILPVVSAIPPGTSPLDDLSALWLPIGTLSLVIAPYMFRMMRGAMIEALGSDSVEMAELKGISRKRVLLVHALPNSLPPVIQVIGAGLHPIEGRQHRPQLAPRISAFKSYAEVAARRLRKPRPQPCASVGGTGENAG